jgi:hypothetical protein
MPQLQVDLEAGFEGDLVILRLSGNELHRFRPKNGENFRATIPAGASKFSFEVEVPARGVFGSSAFTVAGNVVIQLRLESNGVLAFRIQTGDS